MVQRKQTKEMKIPNPTVFLKDGELLCLPGELEDRSKYNFLCDYESALASAKSSAVKVNNKEEFLKNWYRDYLTPNPGGKYCEFEEFITLLKIDELYTLNGYEAEVTEEPEQGSGVDVYFSKTDFEKVATITPIHKSESQEDTFSTWMDVCVLTHAIETEGVTKVIQRLQKHFTIQRKQV